LVPCVKVTRSWLQEEKELTAERTIQITIPPTERKTGRVQENIPAELGYNPQTDKLTLGTLEDFQEYWPAQARTAGGFTCNPSYCDCSGIPDCRDMLHSICGGEFFKCTWRGGAPVRCICSRF
jgi:hypothetical protein